MITLYTNSNNTIHLTVNENATYSAAPGGTGGFGLKLISEMTGGVHTYAPTDSSTYPQYYSTFSIFIPSNFLGGQYRYEVYDLAVEGDFSTYYNTPIECGIATVIQTISESVFTTDEDKNTAVFDED